MGRLTVGENEAAPPQNDCERRRERLSRFKMGRIICSVEVLYEWMSDHTLQRRPDLSRDWHTVEDPFQLLVGIPRLVSMHGLEMDRDSYHPELQWTNPRAWVIRCAAHTMFVQDVLMQWTFKLKTGRLFWLSDRLLSAVREIGLRVLVGDRRKENLVRVGFAQMYRVRLELVHTDSFTRPVRNDHGAPIFTSGDVVPFEVVRLELSCIGQLVCPRQADPIRTNFCSPDLRNWRHVMVNQRAPIQYLAVMPPWSKTVVITRQGFARKLSTRLIYVRVALFRFRPSQWNAPSQILRSACVRRSPTFESKRTWFYRFLRAVRYLKTTWKIQKTQAQRRLPKWCARRKLHRTCC